jgi:hypothetical protein
MAPSTWRGRSRRRARGKGAGGAVKRSTRAPPSPVRGLGAVVDEEVGEFVKEGHESSSSVSTTDQPSFLKSGCRCRRSTRRWSTPAKVGCGVRRSPSRRSRTILTSRQFSKCRRSSAYRSRRLRATTKRSTPTFPRADRSLPRADQPPRHWSEISSRVDEPPRAPDLAPQRERTLELDPDHEPRLRAPARVQHHAQDAVDAEPGVPETGVAHFCGGFLRFMTMSR